MTKTISVAVEDGRLDVSAHPVPHTKGCLWVHRDTENLKAGLWVITHLATGRVLGGGYSTKSQAIGEAAWFWDRLSLTARKKFVGRTGVGLAMMAIPKHVRAAWVRRHALRNAKLATSDPACSE